MPAHTFHHVCLNPAPGVKQDEQAGFYSSRHQPWLTDRRTHTLYTQVKHTTPCSSAGYLLTPHNNNSIQSETEKTTMKVMHGDV